jgi:uncharacterized SAM-dependent methyltransferase
MKPTIRRSTKSISGTSFHGHTVKATRAQLKEALGDPQYVNLDFEEKVQHEWNLEIDGHVFTVYDWKEFRWNKLTDLVEWHIGSHSSVISDYAHRELCELLEK